MKKSKVLKVVCYMLLPILIGVIIIATIYTGINDSTYYNEEKYFESESFVSMYMNRLSNIGWKLIYKNPEYKKIEDGDSYIYYSSSGEFNYDTPQMYFLVIYKNKALTNVELTSEISTIDSIKNYISNISGNHRFDIINGKVNCESEILKKRAEQYQEGFTYRYFTRNNTSLTSADLLELSEYELENSEYISGNSSEKSKIEYITTHIEDFQIYTSYTAKFDENSSQLLSKKFLEIFEPYESLIYILIPICMILAILAVLYLIITVGHKKNENEIFVSDFDKIPLEILVGIAIVICSFVWILTVNKNCMELEQEISLIFTAYFTTYVVLAIMFDTFVKRIKSKTFWKTTIIGKICKLLLKPFAKMMDFIVEIRGTSKFFKNTEKKFIAYSLTTLIIGIVVSIIFVQRENITLAIVLDLIIIAIFILKITKAVINYDKIENKLKEMYDGNNKELLNKHEFLPEFYQSVDYLNDISNGFENAIQDRMKSERLKTELITNVSHDIKTPLTSIINYVDLLKKEDIENEKANEYIEILDNKSQRLKKLIEDLVEASKISTGNVKLNLEKINIIELINQAIGEFEDKFNLRNLNVILDSKENIIYINADSRYMYRVIENLFSNISKYALENSRVYIDISKIEDEVYVEIKNISKDKLNISAEELMQRFVRGDKSRNTEGSGLGLSIAQNLTEAQNGKFNLMLDGDLFKVELIFHIL